MNDLYISKKLEELIIGWCEIESPGDTFWKAVEESGELIQALNKFRQGKWEIDNIQEEAADLLLCLLVLSYQVGQKEVMKNLEAKLKRMDRRYEAALIKKPKKRK
jgi:NTP pyrophosphatase (non-canonical NTP hydrolase)